MEPSFNSALSRTHPLFWKPGLFKGPNFPKCSFPLALRQPRLPPGASQM